MASVVGDLPPDAVLFGRSPAMQQVKAKLTRVCATSVPVLLQGESGAGKSVLSRFIHQQRHHPAGKYVRVNCAPLDTFWGPFALSAVLKSSIASEGNDEGGPTIATLFLDNVGELSPEMQRQLASLLTEYTDECSRNRRGPAFVVSASNRDLRSEMKEGRFRRDLFQQLAVVTIEVPPLRRRMEDVPDISEYMRLRIREQCGAVDRPFPPALLQEMMAYQWPGNLLELGNFVSRFVALGPEHCGSPAASTSGRGRGSRRKKPVMTSRGKPGGKWTM